jgi:hypothetical protein
MNSTSTSHAPSARKTPSEVHGYRSLFKVRNLVRSKNGIVKLIGHAGVAYTLAARKQPDGYLRGNRPTFQLLSYGILAA